MANKAERQANLKNNVAKAADVVKETKTETVAAKQLYSVKDMKAIDLATADKNILAIRATGTRLRRLAHTTAIGILLHWQEHGDWTKLIALGDAIGDTMSKRMRDGFFDWVKAFSSLSYDKDTGKFKNTSKDEKLFNLTGIADAPADTLAFKGALNQPFYDGQFGDAPAHSFDFETAFKAFIVRVERELKRKEEAKTKTEAKRIVIEPDHVKRLEKFAVSLGIVLDDKEPVKQAA